MNSVFYIWKRLLFAKKVIYIFMIMIIKLIKIQIVLFCNFNAKWCVIVVFAGLIRILILILIDLIVETDVSSKWVKCLF